MSTINMNEINGSNRLNDIGGYAPTEARFDVLYMAARRQHCEAMRRAEMSRLARSITQTNAAARTTRRAQNPLAAIAGRIGRWGQQVAPMGERQAQAAMAALRSGWHWQHWQHWQH